MCKARAILCVFTLLGACAAIPEEDKALLAESPDCARAEDQIAALEKLKPSGFKRTLTVLDYATPNGLIGGAIHNDFGDRNKTISGEYGAEISRKILSIKAQCEMQTGL
jgi:hypothetical protein